MSLRILYVGNDLALYEFLQATLDMKILRCVGQSNARLLIRRIKYSAILLDAAEKGLKRSIHRLRIHKNTPVIIVSGPPENVAEVIKRQVIKTMTLAKW
jgi:DNA-binding response OmpR family regulator